MWTPDPIAFTIFDFPIYWYGILITAAALAGILLSMHRAKYYDVQPDTIVDYALFVIPAAIIGARIYYVIFNFHVFAGDWLAIFDLRRGGLAFYGGLIGAIIAGIAVSKYKKIKLLTIMDIAIPAVALGQAIGRWGNFFNQEAYGEAVLNPALQFFPYAVYIENTMKWHMATFFYESAACLLICLFLLWYTKRSKDRGNLVLWYGVLYGIERAIVEGFRMDSLYLGAIRISQLLSVVIVLACGGLLLYRFLKRRKAHVEIDPALSFHIGSDESETAPQEEDASSAGESVERDSTSETAGPDFDEENLPQEDNT